MFPESARTLMLQRRPNEKGGLRVTQSGPSFLSSHKQHEYENVNFLLPAKTLGGGRTRGQVDGGHLPVPFLAG
jgi:hypothetical protein